LDVLFKSDIRLLSTYYNFILSKSIGLTKSIV